MARFDSSRDAMNKVDAALQKFTFYSNRDGDQNNGNNLRARNLIIRRLFDNLDLGTRSSVTFELSLNHSHVHEKKDSALFLEIANIICRNQVQNFHFIEHGKPMYRWERHSRYVISWGFHKYHFVAFTKRSQYGTLDYFMRITDTTKWHDQDADSGADTDRELGSAYIPHGPGSHLNDIFHILNNMHERIKTLESRLG